jgi:hypothetical protein
VLDRPDYGVSAVWLAVLGALLVCAIDAVRAGRPSSIDRLLIVVCPLAALIGFAFFPLLSGSEHLVAFLAGMLVARIYPVSRGGSVPPGVAGRLFDPQKPRCHAQKRRSGRKMSICVEMCCIVGESGVCCVSR